MRIAICFSGMIRTGPEAFSNIKRFIGEYWDVCDFFGHTWDLSFQNPLNSESWDHYNQHYKKSSCVGPVYDKFLELYKPKEFVLEPYWLTAKTIYNMFSSYIDEYRHPRWWFPLFYSWGKSIDYKSNYESRNNFTYDFCVKLRPDLLFSKDINLEMYLQYITDKEFGVNHIWKNSNGIQCDDIFFISKSAIMNRASTWWKYRIKSGEYKKDILPHASFNNFLINQVRAKPIDLGMSYLGTNQNITLYRDECTMFDINEFNKCSECDKLLFHNTNKSDLKYISDKEYLLLKITTLANRNFFPEKQ